MMKLYVVVNLLFKMFLKHNLTMFAGFIMASVAAGGM